MPLHSAYISKFIFIPNFYSRFFFSFWSSFWFRLAFIQMLQASKLLCCILVTNVCWCFVENLHANDREEKNEKKIIIFPIQASPKEYSIQFSHNFICCLLFFFSLCRSSFSLEEHKCPNLFGPKCVRHLCAMCACVCWFIFFRWLIRKWGTDAMWWFRNVLHFC